MSPPALAAFASLLLVVHPAAAYFNRLTTRAGFPNTKTLSGTSFITTAPAATMLQRPTFMPGIITDPAPIWLPSPTVTEPHKVALGEM